ncbi:MAG: hypothetical protein AB8B91_06450 [Rubripirellula sp.]
MPLQDLATEIVRLNERHALTPVLVTPHYLSLRAEFFQELVRALVSLTQRPIRIDWLASSSSVSAGAIPLRLIQAKLAEFRASAINQRLVSEEPARSARIQLTASIARPRGLDQDLVIGCCDERHELPIWTCAIRLGGSPLSQTVLKSA